MSARSGAVVEKGTGGFTEGGMVTPAMEKQLVKSERGKKRSGKMLRWRECKRAR